MKKNVIIADLTVGDKVILEWSNGTGPMLDGYTAMTVTKIDGNFIYFARPHVEIMSLQSFQDIYLRHESHYHILEINGDMVTFSAVEVIMSYRDHKGLFYTVIDHCP